MITRFETGRFEPEIKFMNPQKQRQKSGALSTIRTPALPMLPQMWLPKQSEGTPPPSRVRPVLEIYKLDPHNRD